MGIAYAVVFLNKGNDSVDFSLGLVLFLVELAHASAFKEGNTRESIDKRQRHLPLF